MKKLFFASIQYGLIIACFFLLGRTSVFAVARDITPETVLSAVNDIRVHEGQPIVEMNQKLMVAAENKAKNMHIYGYWAHTNPTTNETGWMFIEQAGYRYAHAGENLAKDYTSVGAVLRGWMNSPTHKNVLLSDKYTETGVGVLYYTQNGVEKALVVQLFATPVSKKQSLTDVVSLSFMKLF